MHSRWQERFNFCVQCGSQSNQQNFCTQCGAQNYRWPRLEMNYGDQEDSIIDTCKFRTCALRRCTCVHRPMYINQLNTSICTLDTWAELVIRASHMYMYMIYVQGYTGHACPPTAGLSINKAKEPLVYQQFRRCPCSLWHSYSYRHLVYADVLVDRAHWSTSRERERDRERDRERESIVGTKRHNGQDITRRHRLRITIFTPGSSLDTYPSFARWQSNRAH